MEREIKERKSFRWTLKLADLTDARDVACPLFTMKCSTFRCIWQRTSIPPKMALELVAYSKPITVRARLVGV